MKKIKIYFNYKHVTEPWGGANNFIRTLYNYILDSEKFEFAADIFDDYDILFLNELGMGPANNSQSVPLRTVRNLKKNSIQTGKEKKIIMRAVNIKRHAYDLGFRSKFYALLSDRATIKLANFANFVIFQSQYQKSFFEEYGYKGKNHIIIHNGADEEFYDDDEKPEIENGIINIISSTAADRKSKRHDLIAKISELKTVRMTHLGRWPENIDRKNVILKGMLNIKEIKKLYKESHFFFHPAIKDPCPNSIFEAILSGLPVIYNPEQGSSCEIVKNNGIPLIEDNLSETIELAKKNYHILRNSIKETKQYYSIKRAAESYINIFSEI